MMKKKLYEFHSEMIRSRKKKAIEEKLKTKPLTSEEEKKLLAVTDDDDKVKKPPDDPLRKTGKLYKGSTAYYVA